MTRVLIGAVVVSFFLNLVLIGYANSVKDNYYKLKAKFYTTKQALKSARANIIREKEHCKQTMALMQTTIQIEKATKKQLKEVIKEGKDYEILYAKPDVVCGCEFDGTGWVFK